jgi:N-acetylneuraminic acid mutarotase
MNIHKWLPATLLFMTLVSCQKDVPPTPAAPANNSKSTTSLVVGLPPAIIWWSHGPDMPMPSSLYIGRRYGVGFTVNGKGFLFGGTIESSQATNIYPNDLWEFDPTTQSWIQKTSYPGAGNIMGVSFVIGDNAYLVIDNYCWQYNQPTDTWTQRKNIPTDRRDLGTAIAINGKGYVGLGWDVDASINTPTFLNDWWQYDPATDSWIKKNNFPGGKRQGAGGFAVDGKGYVCAGQKLSGGYPIDCWQYDPNTDSWLQKANPPGTSPILNSVGLNATVNGGIDYGFIVSGQPGGCLQYNPALNTWGTLPDVPGGGRSYFAGFMINRSLCIAGGTGGPQNFRKDFQALNWSK